MQMSIRIQTIIDMCYEADTIADIGTDHGLVACGLLLQKKAKHVIATDISEASLQKARDLSKKLALHEKMDFRVGDGLMPLMPAEAQGIVLSGMGAPLIIHILRQEEHIAEAAEYILICAYSYPERIRAFCQENQYFIEKEVFVFENSHYYPIMRIVPNREESKAYTRAELLMGRNVAASETYANYLLWQIQLYGQIKEQTKKANDAKRYAEVENMLQLYEKRYRMAELGVDK